MSSDLLELLMVLYCSLRINWIQKTKKQKKTQTFYVQSIYLPRILCKPRAMAPWKSWDLIVQSLINFSPAIFTSTLQQQLIEMLYHGDIAGKVAVGVNSMV